MSSEVNFTDREREILVMAWQSFKTPLQVDYAKLRELGNFKTNASANACYLAVRKKLLATESPKLSVRDREILVMAWQSCKAAPEVDYKQLQQKGGYKTVASANACYLNVKKKLLGETSSPSPTKSGRGKRKAAAELETPTKRSKASPLKNEDMGSNRALETPVDEGEEEKPAVGVKQEAAVENEEESEVKVKNEEAVDEDDDDTAATHLLATAAQFVQEQGK